VLTGSNDEQNRLFICCRNAFRNELTILEKVRHPNVVQFVGAVTQNIPMMIVSELHEEVIATCLFSKGIIIM
jgi:hypothetical protein